MQESTSLPTSEHGLLPLAPIERPRNWFVRLLYWATRRRYGVTPTGFRVLYGRMPAIAFLSAIVMWIKARRLVLDTELSALLPIAVAMGNGCTFCTDLWKVEAVMQRIGRDRLRALHDHEASPLFSEREKAALAYAEALQRSLHVEQAVLDRLRAHFSEREIIEIVWLCAIERYYNAMALPLRVGSDDLYEGARAPS